MSDNLTLLMAGLMLGAFVAGIGAERWVVSQARRKWRKRKDANTYANASQKLTDASDQLRVVMAAVMERLQQRPHRPPYKPIRAWIARVKGFGRICATVSI